MALVHERFWTIGTRYDSIFVIIWLDLVRPAVVGILEVVNLGFVQAEESVDVCIALPLEECRIENGVLSYVEKHFNHMAKNDLLFFFSRW